MDRRAFLNSASAATMAGGLTAGYGTFFAWAGRYLFPADVRTLWLFVCDAAAIAPGGSRAFESPTGVAVTVTRRGDSPADRPPSVDQFLALSSVCPHLGCRVHWEPHNARFFCPCHNGVFDAEGKATSGPPADAGQRLPPYPLLVENGLLFIQMPVETLGGPT
jgi:nitrite reductase/ring-hydroxylating ferredoxin subunit